MMNTHSFPFGIHFRDVKRWSGIRGILSILKEFRRIKKTNTNHQNEWIKYEIPSLVRTFSIHCLFNSAKFKSNSIIKIIVQQRRCIWLNFVLMAIANVMIHWKLIKMHWCIQNRNFRLRYFTWASIGMRNVGFVMESLYHNFIPNTDST